jgi:THO complex subunit 1
MAKEYGFSARTIFISPPSLEELETRMRKKNGLSDEDIQRQLKDAQKDIDLSITSGDLYDKIITNDNLEATYKMLEEFIYQTTETNGVHEDEGLNGDSEMKDETNGAE